MSVLERIFGKRIEQKQPVELTDENYEEIVLKSNLPVVVDVWGERCPPCSRLEPIIMTLAGKYDGDVVVAELNASRYPRTVVSLGVRSTPTVLYYRPRGRLVERVSGFRGRLYHEEVIDNELLAP